MNPHTGTNMLCAVVELALSMVDLTICGDLPKQRGTTQSYLKFKPMMNNMNPSPPTIFGESECG